MPPVLTKKLIGLPRWAWIAVLAGGLAIGLVIRANRKDDEEVLEEEWSDVEDVPLEEPLYDPAMAGYQAGDPGFYLTPSQTYGGSGYGFEDGLEFLPEPIADPLPSGVDNGQNTGGSSGGGGSGGAGGNTDPAPAVQACPTKPTTSPGAGMKWVCKNGRWVKIPRTGVNAGSGGGGSGGASGSSGGRPPRPQKDLPAGWTWVYKANLGRWVQHRIGSGTGTGNTRPATGGGPPVRPPGAHLPGGSGGSPGPAVSRCGRRPTRPCNKEWHCNQNGNWICR